MSFKKEFRDKIVSDLRNGANEFRSAAELMVNDQLS
jgi:hypothetical protein